MIRMDATITYPGGRTEQVVITQAEYAAWELWAIRHGLSAMPDQAPPMLMTRYLGYAAAQRAAGLAQKDWADFDSFDADDVTMEAGEGGAIVAAADPFPKDRSVG